MYSCVLLVGLIARWARGIGGAEVVVADVDIRCGHTAGTVRDLVETVDYLSGWSNPNVVGKQNGLLHLRKSRQAIVGLASDVHRVAWVDDSGASEDNDRILWESGGEGEGGSRSLVRVHISTVLLPCILLRLAGSRALATVCLLLLLLASLLLLQQPIPPLRLLSLLLLLLLELGVPWVVLDGADLVYVAT